MNGHDHLIERRRANATQPQRWEVLTHAGRVVAVVYTEADAFTVKRALDGAAAVCPECPHCIANMANWSTPA